MMAQGCEIHLGRYKSLYREGGKAENMFILLEGTLEHTALESELSEALRYQVVRGDGGTREKDGTVVHGLAVGQETLTNVARMTTASAITHCRLLQFSAADLGLNRDAMMREFVRRRVVDSGAFAGLGREARRGRRGAGPQAPTRGVPHTPRSGTSCTRSRSSTATRPRRSRRCCR